MKHELTARGLDRRGFLKLSGLGAATLATSGGLAAALARGEKAQAVVAQSTTIERRLVATDGHIHLPGRPGPRDLFTLGFREALVEDFSALVPPPATAADIPMYELAQAYKGNVKVTAPHIALNEGDILHLTLTNVGFLARPDLDDSHTVHWHGFRNPISLFDGTPEMSIAVPPYRSFTYFYRGGTQGDPLAGPGTYIYHCHFEDSEHVQLRMTGIVWIRPAQDGTPFGPYSRFAYNDGDGSTGYDREFALLLSEVDERPADNLEKIQEFIWSDYQPQYWIINGRAYPDTIEPNNPPSGDNLEFQPNSSLMQVNPGDRVLMRMSSLGFEQHAMQLPGIELKVVGEDATLLRGPTGADLSYGATTLYIGPGESRDALFTAPDFTSSSPVLTDDSGNYNRYFLRNRNLHKLTNKNTTDPATGLGGMVTEVRVYDPAGTPLPPQAEPNQTYPV